VYEDDGGTHVACRLPKTVFAPYDSEALMAVGEELETIFINILGHVPEA
jgi:hypothetical protein